MWCNLRFKYGKSCNVVKHSKNFFVSSYRWICYKFQLVQTRWSNDRQLHILNIKEKTKSTCGLRSLVLHQPLILYWYVTKAKEEEKRSRAFHVHNNRNVLLNQIYYNTTMSGIMIHALLAFLGNHSCKVFTMYYA